MIEDILLPYISGRFREEPHYRLGHIRIVNPLPGTAILGLHIPDMKKIAKELSARDDRMEILHGLGRNFKACADEKTAVYCRT